MQSASLAALYVYACLEITLPEGGVATAVVVSCSRRPLAYKRPHPAGAPGAFLHFVPVDAKG
jgi:hypothetical protein